VFFLLAAFLASGVLGNALETLRFVGSGRRIDRVALLGVLLFGVTIGMAMIGFGIRAGRGGVALLGTLAVGVGVAIRLVWGLFW
jgi:hypothetical protein